MVNHTCQQCLKCFHKKSAYLYHISRKFPCQKREPDNTINVNTQMFTSNTVTQQQNVEKPKILTQKIEETKNDINNDNIDKNLICPHCNKTFTTVSSKLRHIKKFCSEIKNDGRSTSNLDLLKQIKEENNRLNLKNKKLHFKNKELELKNKKLELKNKEQSFELKKVTYKLKELREKELTEKELMEKEKHRNYQLSDNVDNHNYYDYIIKILNN